MTAPINYGDTWKSQRNAWKKQIGASTELSASTKVLGAHLCDGYANHKTACCWMGNDTLAKDLNVNVRSIQRGLKELQANGYAQKVRLPRRRRALQLVFPGCSEGDSEHDTSPPPRVTSRSFEHDRSVCPYIEPKKNLRKSATGIRPIYGFRYLIIGEDDTSCIAEWKGWISAHIENDRDEIFKCLTVRGGFALPSRYPTSDPSDAYVYRQFFSEAVRSAGAMFRQ